MYVLNMKEKTIKQFNSMDLSMFINDLIKHNDQRLLNKTFLFVPTKKAVKYIIESSQKGLS
jgi:hypothetical protein